MHIVAVESGTTPNTIEVDLSNIPGGAFGIRYGWQGGGSCFAEQAPGNFFCEPASCPLMLQTAKLPANPFMAKIVDGKCKCMPPQVCDE